MKTKLIRPAIVCISIFISCNTKDKTLMEHVTYATEMKEVKTGALKLKEDDQSSPIPTATLQRADSSAPLPTAKAGVNTDWDKKIIKTASVKLEVKDFKNYNSSIHKTVKQFGGYIAQEQQNLGDEKLETVIAIKVPVEQFETMMDQIPGGEDKVLERTISTEDVTGQVVDTKSRLEAKKQMRIKYLEFLKQSKNMEEVLQVQNEVNSIQEEIESAAGRVAFLSHQSAYSTINLTFFQPLAGYKPVDTAPSFFARTSTAFKKGSEWIINLFVGLMSVWPLVLIITGLFIGWKKIKIQRKPITNSPVS